MDGLNFAQRGEVERIVNNEFAKRDFMDIIQKFLGTRHFDQALQDGANRVVPLVANDWVTKNLRGVVENQTDAYMRHGLPRHLRAELTDSKEWSSFVQQQVAEFKQKVHVITKETAAQVINTGADSNPILQAYFDRLSRGNAQTLAHQSQEIKKYVGAFQNVQSENTNLRARVSDLERSNKTISAVAGVTLLGMVGIGYRVFCN